MAVIYVQAFVFVILFGKLMRKVFFGSLRAAEFEHLLDRSWYAVTETCLAFTVFKDDFSPKFVALFTILLFLKSFHWLAEDRVDYMERSPSISLLFHTRVVSLALLLAIIDVNFIVHAYQSTLSKGASVQLVFGFEYAVLLTIVANTVIKYILHSIDLYSENPWENKAVFMLYTELVIGLFKVILYGLFIIIMVRIYTLPLFAVRPMYLTARAFKKAFNDVILSRRAIHNMNTWYPDATAEELENSDNVCIICREEMVAASTKKLPCGHIFHKNCLRSWFQRQQTCPTCRLDVLRAANPGQPIPRRQPAQRAQPQHQQQPQAQAGGVQQQQPNVNQMFAQLMAANARLQFPPAPAPPPTPPTTVARATPSTTSTSTTTTAASSTSTGAGAATSNSLPPFPMPPFFMPPFSIPPPLPPQNFTGLTDDELKAMEGHERANVEARIKCLRNIQVLLDAAVMEMQQYSSVVSQLDIASKRPEAAIRATAPSPPAPPEAEPGSESSSTGALAQAETGARPKIRSETKESLTSNPNDGEQDQVRRRRLERFAANPE